MFPPKNSCYDHVCLFPPLIKCSELRSIMLESDSLIITIVVRGHEHILLSVIFVWLLVITFMAKLEKYFCPLYSKLLHIKIFILIAVLHSVGLSYHCGNKHILMITVKYCSWKGVCGIFILLSLSLSELSVFLLRIGT